MKRLSAFIACLFLLPAIPVYLSSCGGKTPEGILSRNQMVEIMEDLYIAEEKVNYLALSRDSAVEVAALMENKVFEKAAISDTLFRKSFDYYMERPREMELIYTALVDSLQLKEQRAPMETPTHQ